MNWKYQIKSGKALREAIDNEDMEQVVERLLFCCIELNKKLYGEDCIAYGLELDDIYIALSCYEPSDDDEDEEMINEYLEQFYDICDDVKAWIEL